MLPITSCPATRLCPGCSVIFFSCLLDDSSHLACVQSLLKAVANKTRVDTKSCQKLELGTGFGLSQHVSGFSKLVFFWGGCHPVPQQLSICFSDSAGVNPSPLIQWQNSHHLQGDQGAFSSLWAHCGISSVWCAVPALCVSFVCCGLFDTTAIVLC